MVRPRPGSISAVNRTPLELMFFVNPGSTTRSAPERVMETGSWSLNRLFLRCSVNLQQCYRERTGPVNRPRPRHLSNVLAFCVQQYGIGNRNGLQHAPVLTSMVHESTGPWQRSVMWCYRRQYRRVKAPASASVSLVRLLMIEFDRRFGVILVALRELDHIAIRYTGEIRHEQFGSFGQ